MLSYISKGPINFRLTLNDGICIRNSKTKIRVTLTSSGTPCLAGTACSRNYQTILVKIVFRDLQAKFCIPLVKVPKKVEIVGNNYICLFYVMLGFIIEGLALVICIYRLRPVKILG